MNPCLTPPVLVSLAVSFLPPGQFLWSPVDRALTLAVLAQSLATLRCCSLARDVIILADIFEEEDFYPSTFGFRLAPPVEDDSLTDLLALAEGAVRERVSAKTRPRVGEPRSVCVWGLTCLWDASRGTYPRAESVMVSGFGVAGSPQ